VGATRAPRPLHTPTTKTPLPLPSLWGGGGVGQDTPPRGMPCTQVAMHRPHQHAGRVNRSTPATPPAKRGGQHAPVGCRSTRTPWNKESCHAWKEAKHIMQRPSPGPAPPRHRKNMPRPGVEPCTSQRFPSLFPSHAHWETGGAGLHPDTAPAAVSVPGATPWLSTAVKTQGKATKGGCQAGQTPVKGRQSGGLGCWRPKHTTHTCTHSRAAGVWAGDATRTHQQAGW
jgi:hypothetical protein